MASAQIACDGLIFDDERVRITLRSGTSGWLAKGEEYGGVRVRYVGHSVQGGIAVLELTDANGGEIGIFCESGDATGVSKPTPGAYERPDVPMYGGETLETVLMAERDLLGDLILAGGEPSFDAIVGLLPAACTRRYQIIGSPRSKTKYLVTPDGSILTTNEERPSVVYAPSLVDAGVTRGTAIDGLLDDWMPSACYRYESDDAVYELIAFVLPEACWHDPWLFTRLACYRSDGHVEREYFHEAGYRVKNMDREDRLLRSEPGAFYAALWQFLKYWRGFEAELAIIDVPEPRVTRWVKGTLALAATTFIDAHPKYGARYYGGEFHDTMPQCVLSASETMLLWGASHRAVEYLRYYLARIVRDDGSFIFYGPSGTDYGKWLWLLDHVEDALGVQPWITENLDRVAATGQLLEDLRVSDSGDERLIRIAAEPDNSHEAYAYFSNNLWGVVGQQALARLQERHGAKEASRVTQARADSLRTDVFAAVERAQEPTVLGPLIPSHIGYPANPWTLSIGPDLPPGIPREERDAYFAAIGPTPSLPWSRDIPFGFADEPGAPRQWIRENTYANYRYHMESLATMLLPAEVADAMVRLRETRGGEVLGMSRFMGWLDDWPIANYARYLLATDQVDKYLLLYYSHMAHHGNRETLTYYEQVGIDGVVHADDCVPSLLVTSVMTAWMFAFEPIGEDALYLARGVPRAWLSEGQEISVRGLRVTAGSVALRISSNERHVDIAIELPHEIDDRQIYADVRLPSNKRLSQATEGGEWITTIHDGYRISVARGSTGSLGARIGLV
jgi:hypothetical protein